MSTTQTILLGAIAGFTIYLGLPLGRVQVTSLKTKAFLNAASAGILVFLLFEILAHATEPVEEALKEAAEGEAAWAAGWDSSASATDIAPGPMLLRSGGEGRFHRRARYSSPSSPVPKPMA